MRPMFRKLSPEPRLYLLTALAAAFLLVPAAMASAAPVQILFEGSGSGTVTGDPFAEGNPKIECHWNGTAINEGTPSAGECNSETVEAEGEGSQAIKVNGVADSGSELAGWKVESGFVLSPLFCKQTPEAPGSSCTVQSLVGEEVIIKAIFECEGTPPCPPPGGEVPVTIEVEGEGEVSSSPAGIACTEAENGEPACENEFAEASEPGLEAEAAAGWIFTGWETVEGNAGGCEGTTSPCEVGPLTEPTKLKATFEELNVHITIEGEGSGTVIGTAGHEGTPPIDCHWNGETEVMSGVCDALAFPEGPFEIINVLHEAAPGSVFGGWTLESGFTEGGCEPFAAECVAAIVGPITEVKIKAVFNPISHTLTVDATGEGSVSAVPPPAPVSGEISGCEEAECSAEYGEGQTVTLEATPGEHRETVWTSGCDNVPSADVCEVEIPTGDVTVEAEFITAPQGTLTVEATGEGSVSAEASPPPASGEIAACEEGGGAECSADYFQGETVTLVATPGEHQQVAWTGCDSEPTANECEVEVDSAAVTVEADFTQITHTLGVTEAGTGSGSVECKIDGGAAGPCSGPIDEGAEVEVIASPAAHSTFDGYSEGTGSATGCEAEGSPCVIGELLVRQHAESDVHPDHPHAGRYRSRYRLGQRRMQDRRRRGWPVLGPDRRGSRSGSHRVSRRPLDLRWLQRRHRFGHRLRSRRLALRDR